MKRKQGGLCWRWRATKGHWNTGVFGAERYRLALVGQIGKFLWFSKRVKHLKPSKLLVLFRNPVQPANYSKITFQLLPNQNTKHYSPPKKVTGTQQKNWDNFCFQPNKYMLFIGGKISIGLKKKTNNRN